MIYFYNFKHFVLIQFQYDKFNEIFLFATFFAVFASFTNLALSFSNLFTKYLNEIFVVTREVKDKINDKTLINSDYSELGILILIVFIITLTIPILSVIVIQKTKYKTNEQ